MVFISIILVIYLLLASIYDVSVKKIPNCLSLCVVILGVTGNYYFPEGMGLLNSAKGLGAGLLMMLPFYIFASLGAGDVKMMSAIGSVLGYQPMVSVVIVTYIAASTLALIFIIFEGNLSATIKRYWCTSLGLFAGIWNYQQPQQGEATAIRMPFAPAMTVAVVYVLYAEQLKNFFLQLPSSVF